MVPSHCTPRWEPEDERDPDTATPVVFADSHKSAFAAPDAKVFRSQLDARCASICRPSNVYWGNNKYTSAQIKKVIDRALRRLPTHPEPGRAPVHHHYATLRRALDRPIREILHGEADPDLAVASAVLWWHIDNILEGRTSASGEGRYSSDVMVEFGLKMATSGTRCHFIAGENHLKNIRAYDVRTPSMDYHRVRALRLGAFAMAVNDSEHWTAFLHHIASRTTYIFEPGPRPPKTRWTAHLEIRINVNKLLLLWGLRPTSSYVVMGGESQLGSWQCGYILILQFMSFLHGDGLLKWEQSNMYKGLPTPQAREAYGMRKIADWALHLWTGDQENCCPSPEMSELLTLSERLIQQRRIASLKSKYPGLPATTREKSPPATNAVSLLDNSVGNGNPNSFLAAVRRVGSEGTNVPDMSKLRLFGLGRAFDPTRKRKAAPPDVSMLSISPRPGQSKRPAVRKRVSAPPDLAGLSISPSVRRRAMGRPLYPHFTAGGWEKPAGMEYDAAAAREEVLAKYADPSFKRAEAWPKVSHMKYGEFRFGGELGRAYDYLLTMVSQNPGRAAKIGLSAAALRDGGAWLKLVTALIIKRGDPMRALEYIGRCYPRAP